MTSPVFPATGRFGTHPRPPASVGAGLISQRTPYVIVKLFLIFHSSWTNRLYCFNRCPSFHSVTLLFTTNGRNASWLISPRKFCDNRAGIPIMSLMVPRRRALSVGLMPAAIVDAIAGVVKPEGGRTVALNVK